MRKMAVVLIFLPMAAFAQDRVLIAALGDSLTQGFGLPEADGFVPQLQRWLDAQGESVKMINAGVSGDTTAGGAARIGWTLTSDVDALMVTLGGNDLLRGLPPEQARANIEQILSAAQDAQIPVLLSGLTAPLNYGPEYKRDFEAIYTDLSEQYGAILYQDFLASLTSDLDREAALATYMQADFIHPNADGVAQIVADIGPFVRSLIERVK
ncbi:MAG: arylesterase [Pseudomonadota bacterium]